MSFKLRNTIALGVVALLITLAGGFWYWYWQPGDLEDLTAQIQVIDQELDNLPIVTEEVEQLTMRLREVRRQYDSRSKEIPQFDISSQTYGYMSQGIDAAGFLRFNMRFLGTRDQGSYGYNAYALENGEAKFWNLYRFVYFLENGKRLYKISSLELTQMEQVDEETKETETWIEFKMELHAYFVKDIPELSTSLAAKSLPVVPAPFNPFDPLILQSIATAAPEDELDVKNMEVKAVLPGKVFVLYNGELLVLQLGDKVWRGFVSAIEPSEGEVQFTLNEGGVIRKEIKKIQFERRRRRS